MAGGWLGFISEGAHMYMHTFGAPLARRFCLLGGMRRLKTARLLE